MSTRIERRMAAKLATQSYGGDWGDWEHRFTPTKRAGPEHGLMSQKLINGWCNNVFAVQHFPTSGLEKVMVRRHDSGTRVTWSDLQRIKNELFGPERMAVQVLPRESQLVDVANMYWFFLIPDVTKMVELYEKCFPAGN